MEALDKLSVLVIEDEPGDQHIIRHMLKKLEVSKISIVSTIEAAKALVHEEIFDCALLDWNLPDGFGREFLLSVSGRLPVILLTGDEEEVSPSDAFALGSHDYINKNELTPRLLERTLRYASIRQDRARTRANIVDVERLRLVGRIASGVAHEVNNPLAWLTSNMDFLTSIFGTPDSPLENDQFTLTAEQAREAKELLSECKQAMVRIQNTSQTLLEFAELKYDRSEVLELNSVIALALEVSSHQLAATIPVSVSMAPEALLFEGNEGLITQALTHALINAGQAIERAGQDRAHEIIVSTHADSGFVRVRIKDTGDGIDPSMEKHAFQPFVTISPNRSGMGLAFVARAMALHHGEVCFLETERGACIQFSFMQASNDEQLTLTSDLEDTIEVEPVFLSELRILVIDSKPHMTKLFLLLAGAHCEFVRVESLEESLEVLEKDTCFDGVFVNVSSSEFQQHGLSWYQNLAMMMPAVATRIVVCSVGDSSQQLEDFLVMSKAMLFKGPFNFSGLDPIIWHWKMLSQSAF